MSPTLEACLRSWPFAPWLLVGLLLSAGVYLRGWLVLQRRSVTLPSPPSAGGLSGRWSGGRLAAFLGGLSAVYVALSSPIEPLADLLLQVHMLQHLLLMMVVAPLLWLAAPLLPLLRGLPRPVLMYWVSPLLASRRLRRLFGRLTSPLVTLPVFVTATWLWHVPPLYDLALRSSGWHYAQHACFLASALLFWYPVVRPYPCRPRWSPWLLLPYLLLADLSNTALSAVLTFSDRVLYPHYAEVPRLAGISVLDDQTAAGVLMWVPGSFAFLVPLFAIGVRLLSGQGSEVRSRRSETRGQGTRPASGRIALPLMSSSLTSDLRPLTSGFDLLRLPLLGRFLKWRHARLCLQIPLLLLAAVMIYDGLRGPQVGAMNLAGVLPWIHWRGLTIIGLLVAGNVFCMGCPFMLPRTLARRFLPAGWSWPRRLRSKWLAVLLVVAFLWAYEALALWDRPRWTACLALGYFVAAFVIDGLFRDASFCKYLCPIGQFNFVQSLASPLEVKAREPAVCDSCSTKDCIRGRDGIPGCELHLFLPRKASSMDCTTCLDCVHACPHDNVGLIAVRPGAELWNDRQRSGIGRFGRRPDIAALIVVLVFGAFANAAGMVGPVLEWRDWLGSFLERGGLTPARSQLFVTSVFYLFGLLVLPMLAVGGAAALSRRWGRLGTGWFEVATRYSFALVPLGFSMWLAHYSFHLLTSYDTVVPTVQRFALDLGWSALGQPHWVASCCRPVAEWLPRLEVLCLDTGLLLSLYAGYRITLTQSLRLSQALRALAPWALLMTLLFAAGTWLVFQPMQMRGTLDM